MQQIIKSLKLVFLTIISGVFFTAVTVSAQSPADDPGIGGPGSPSVGVGGDGSPVVPLDRDLSILLISAGIAYGYTKMKKQQVAVN
jgi:hypothetical protein